VADWPGQPTAAAIGRSLRACCAVEAYVTCGALPASGQRTAADADLPRPGGAAADDRLSARVVAAASELVLAPFPCGNDDGPWSLPVAHLVLPRYCAFRHGASRCKLKPSGLLSVVRLATFVQFDVHGFRISNRLA
jgi:hypothetical protein